MSTSEFPQTFTLICGPVQAVDLSLYAAASGDHNPLHLDEGIAQTAGFDRPVVHGMLSMAYAGRLMTQHFGAASLAHLHTRFTGVALRGQTLHLKATFERFEGDLAHYSIEAHNEEGRQVLSGTAHVRKTGWT